MRPDSTRDPIDPTWPVRFAMSTCYASQVNDEIVWLEESPAPALDALYLDSISLNEWMRLVLFSKKKKG